ncbi:MAG: ice-binding family protein [Arhodomonas sp.]|nr:ice-binding family protein [Arhodomonas sp.]
MGTRSTVIAQSEQIGICVPKTNSSFKRACHGLLAGLGFYAFLLVPAPAVAQVAPDLGSTSTFGIVSSTWSDETGGTAITGDVCYTTEPAALGSITISGATETPCSSDKDTDQNAVLAELDAQSCTSLGSGAVELNAISIGGGPPGVFPPGCYSSGGAMNITTGTTVTLSGAGVYIFRPGGAFTQAADSNVVAAGGACENDVFWTPTGATTIGANANSVGNIFRGTADGLSITFGDSSSLVGRALAYGSTVTTANTSISVPTCEPFDTPVPEDGAVALGKTLARAPSQPEASRRSRSTLSNNNEDEATLDFAAH